MYIAIEIVYNIFINQLTDSSVADETFDITFFCYRISSCHAFVECLVEKADCYWYLIHFYSLNTFDSTIVESFFMYKIVSLVYNITINRLIRTFELKFATKLPFLKNYIFILIRTKIDKQPIDNNSFLFEVPSRWWDFFFYT